MSDFGDKLQKAADKEVADRKAAGSDESKAQKALGDFVTNARQEIEASSPGQHTYKGKAVEKIDYATFSNIIQEKTAAQALDTARKDAFPNLAIKGITGNNNGFVVAVSDAKTLAEKDYYTKDGFINEKYLRVIDEKTGEVKMAHRTWVDESKGITRVDAVDEKIKNADKHTSNKNGHRDELQLQVNKQRKDAFGSIAYDEHSKLTKMQDAAGKTLFNVTYGDDGKFKTVNILEQGGADLALEPTGKVFPNKKVEIMKDKSGVYYGVGITKDWVSYSKLNGPDDSDFHNEITSISCADRGTRVVKASTGASYARSADNSVEWQCKNSANSSFAQVNSNVIDTHLNIKLPDDESLNLTGTTAGETHSRGEFYFKDQKSGKGYNVQVNDGDELILQERDDKAKASWHKIIQPNGVVIKQNETAADSAPDRITDYWIAGMHWSWNEEHKSYSDDGKRFANIKRNNDNHKVDIHIE